MFRSLACRQCLRQFQQHSFRLRGSAEALSQTRGISTTTEPDAPLSFFKVVDKHHSPFKRLPAFVSIKKRPIKKRPKRRPFLDKTPRESIAAKLEAITSKNPVRYDEGWARAWAQDSVDRGMQWSFLRHHLNKDGRKAWKQWRRDIASLFEYLATGELSATKQRNLKLLRPEKIENDIGNWPRWNTKRMKLRWQRLMFNTLWSFPDRALVVLQTTTKDIKLSGYMINDAVHFLSRWQKTLEGDKRIAHAESLCDFTIECFDTCSDGTGRLRQNTIYNLIQDVDPERIERLYSFLLNRKNAIHEQTHLQIASRLAKFSTHKPSPLKIAVDVMLDGKVNLDSTGWLSVCTSILHMKPEDIEKGGDFSAADAFSILLEHGFRPNMVNYTAVIRSLCISGELDKAWNVFDLMRRHEIEPDPTLFATLLDGAKRAYSATTIHKLAEDAAQHNAVDVVVLNDLLMSILQFSEDERKRKRSNRQHVQSVPAFGPMLHYYTKVFNLAPLQALIPLDLSAYTDQFGREMPDDWEMARELFPALDVATSAVRDKLHPTGATLSIMYIAFTKNLAQPIKLISLYAYFRQLILNKHPIAVQFVREKGTFIYDVILKALLERPGMQRPALDIMADMLRDTLEEKEGVPKVKKHAMTHPPPSIYTWNILLAGCLFSREKKLGNKIAHMMRTRGVPPNAVTWNTLISGYAGLQDANRTVKALQGLESSGFEADMYTMRGFSRLVNREKALRLLEKKIELSEIKRAAFRAAESREQSNATAAMELTDSVPQDETGGITKEGAILRERPEEEPHQGLDPIAELDVRPDDPLLEAFLERIPLDEVVQKQAPGWMKTEDVARRFTYVGVR